MTQQFSRRLVIGAVAALAVGAAQAKPSPRSLVGAWDVSLFFDPAQPPSKADMTIDTVSKKLITGSFYGSPFIDGMIVREKGGRLYKAVTRDQSSDYFHEWRIEKDGSLKGETISPQRNFRMAWTAVKKS